MQKPSAHMFSNRLWAPRTSYEAVKSETDDGVREESRHCTHCHCHSPGFKKAGASRVVLVTGIFLITVFLFLLFAVSLDSYLSPVNEALRQTVFFCRLYAAEHMILSQLISDAAPILQEREIPSYTTMMNGTLFSPPHPSMARQEPSLENDAEWRQYINTTIFQLSRDEVVKLGKDPNTAARLDPEYWGVGDDVYYGKFDISHEIHCLDELRRATFAGYPGYHPKGHRHHDGTGDRVNWIHLGHCVDMLLQFLMCNADTAVLTMSYVEGQEAPWPDFNINRQCRDYNTLEEWAKTRAIDAWKMNNAPRPRDAHLWPNPLRQDHVDSELGFPLGDHHQQEGHPELVQSL